MGVQMVILILFILFNAKKIRNGKPEIIESDSEEEIVEVPVWTYVLPVMPVALSILLNGMQYQHSYYLQLLPSLLLVI